MSKYSRRRFLTRTGLAALGAGISGCASTRHFHDGGARGKSNSVVRVLVDGKDPLVTRTFAIMKDRIEQRCTVEVVEANKNASVVLSVDDKLKPESYRIDAQGKAVCVSGGSPLGLLYGVGKLLRTSRYDGAAFEATPWRGTSSPRGTLRGMYFASHFHNWYHQASQPEIARYLEDLALWGVNTLKISFPMINLRDWDDPQTAVALNMMRTYARTAHELGIQFATGINNTMFNGAPKEVRAGRLPDPTHRRGNSGNPICPSNPAGHAYLMEHAERLYKEMKDVGLDIVVFWPYDEGGCSCDKCAPWGSNGYLKLSRDFANLGRRYFPGLKTVLSTWMFDTPPEGEWQGLTDALAKENGWVDYILADSHEDFPRYPLESGVPGNLPLLNFPEISMWGNSPWGGFGANPLPARFQRLWDQVKHVVSGGFPYSEGIYEDMNKAAVVQFYWDPDRSARTTLQEYIAYEFGPGVTDDVLAIVDAIEDTSSRSYRKQPVDAGAVRRAAQLGESVHNRLPAWAKQNWRWEILHLRTILDAERFGGGGLQSPTAEVAMLRLIDIYHCQIETDDPYHHRVRPPLKRAVDRNGRL